MATVAPHVSFRDVSVRHGAVSALERMEDHAVGNCEYAALIDDAAPTADLATLADFVGRMVREAMEAFAHEDRERAEIGMQLDEQVDAPDPSRQVPRADRRSRHQHLRGGFLPRGR
jgi:phosphate uptake regulator